LVFLRREKSRAILKVKKFKLFDFLENGLFAEVLDLFVGLLGLIEHLAVRVLKITDRLKEKLDFFVKLVQQFLLNEGLLHLGLLNPL
jgi:hypothetical protein